MADIIELPPPPRGDTQQQLDELREYVLRLVLILKEEN